MKTLQPCTFTIDTPRRYTLMRGSINNAQGSGSFKEESLLM